MKDRIVYIDKPYQGLETENPQLIDGELKCWEVRQEIVREKTLNEWFKRQLEKKWINRILFHDAESIHYHFCDQGCKPGHGCKQNYSEDNHKLMVTYACDYNEIEYTKFKNINAIFNSYCIEHNKQYCRTCTDKFKIEQNENTTIRG